MPVSAETRAALAAPLSITIALAYMWSRIPSRFCGNCVGVMSSLAAPTLKEGAVDCEKAPHGNTTISNARIATLDIFIFNSILELRKPRSLQDPNPHFSQAFYCGGGSGHVYCVALGRAPRHTVEYVCGALGRAPCIHARLRRLATKPCEKCGLSSCCLVFARFHFS